MPYSSIIVKPLAVVISFDPRNFSMPMRLMVEVLQETLIAAIFSCTLFTTSGSGPGSTFWGFSLAQLSHFSCEQLSHTVPFSTPGGNFA